MIIRRKDERRDMKRSKNRRVTCLGGTQVVYWFCLNIWKLEVMGDFFFRGKTCKPLLVRGTISFYNQKLQFFPIGESVMWNMSMWLMSNVECELFRFQLCLINCKSVLISWTSVLVWMFFSTFMMSFPLWVMVVLTVDELSYHIYFYSCLYVWL